MERMRCEAVRVIRSAGMQEVGPRLGSCRDMAALSSGAHEACATCGAESHEEPRNGPTALLLVPILEVYPS